MSKKWIPVWAEAFEVALDIASGFGGLYGGVGIWSVEGADTTVQCAAVGPLRIRHASWKAQKLVRGIDEGT